MTSIQLNTFRKLVRKEKQGIKLYHVQVNIVKAEDDERERIKIQETDNESLEAVLHKYRTQFQKDGLSLEGKIYHGI